MCVPRGLCWSRMPRSHQEGVPSEGRTEGQTLDRSRAVLLA